MYAVGYPSLTADGYRMAAVLACGSGAVLSHRSAAALWGLRTDGRASIDVTAPNRRGRIPTGIDAHRHSFLRPQDCTSVREIPCTSVARTLLDLAAVVGIRELENAVAEAEVLRVFDHAAVREVIARGRGRRGVARLRLAVIEHDPRAELARGPLERRFLALCRRAGLPPPEVNVLLEVAGVRLEPDFLWRDAGLIVETDGRKYHDTTTAFERDRRRDQRLTVAGWQVVRCTWRQVVDEPTGLARTLRTLLHRPKPPPTGLKVEI